MTSAISVPSRELVNYPPEFNQQVIAALTAASSEITALQGTAGALDWKDSVLCATTGALAANTRTGNVLTANANGALGALDGVTPVATNRILVKNEATQANNGLYVVTNAGAGGAPWVLTRSTDADESAEVTPNLAVMVEQGTVNQDKIFVLDINGPVTLNTTALVFTDWRGLAITAPADVTKAAAAVGTSTTLARSDHKHDVSTAAAVTIGTANGEGAASSLARSDHVHDHGAQTAPTHHAVATTADNGFMSAADKTKLDSIQNGSATLVNGTVAVATANITASSRVQLTHTAANASTALGIPFAESLTPGTPGSFTINARNPTDATLQANDQSSVFWTVIG
jgi:hypothetical protein